MENTKLLSRSEEITEQYFLLLDKHLLDVVEQRATEMMSLKQIAETLFVSHQHLTDTIQKTMGQHPCHFYDLKIIDWAKTLLLDPKRSVREIAFLLTYDPSNFSKFFKKMTGKTPGEFRKTSSR
ncbi:AraC family transcriptional regulator [Olivibacter sp. CPCC 100613]|uniref:helix-turn-helix domain-containing protein n=1 Tax=Olivibacter sp. CPCC 100613 TaxID=3079931 RepID=UPI002FFAF65B